VTKATARWGSVAIAGVLVATVLSQGLTAMAASRETASKQVTLLETGSTLLYPLFNIWVPAYTRSHPGVRITTGGTGSGTGISEAEKGQVQIGASDAYLPPSHPASTMNIPLAVSAQMISYNVPGLNGEHLKLSGPVLAGIYSGKITKWNAPQIRALNPGVKLPSHAIIPIRRADSSGDTFLFTQFLTDSAGKAWTAGYGTTVSWPELPSLIAETGNSGMVSGVEQSKFSIAYIGVSYQNETAKAGMGEAMLKNRAGKFVLPQTSTVMAAADARVNSTPKNEALSLVFAPGANSYPIINYEYAIVSKTQSSTAIASAVRTFLNWALTTGNGATFLNQVHFRPLPATIVKMSKAQVAQIH
jgi:phosphate transport system substrate-binding protein